MFPVIKLSAIFEGAFVEFPNAARAQMREVVTRLVITEIYPLKLTESFQSRSWKNSRE